MDKTTQWEAGIPVLANKDVVIITLVISAIPVIFC
ncbi:hypothetical protein QFZ77_003432 [Paenibacillus sp. V4I3]|nr:hypothetical protein [Paenibacillus sp. V4I3]MDQ0889475.1 hypothetical protein [Paenibacillus sp. V4I9]